MSLGPMPVVQRSATLAPSIPGPGVAGERRSGKRASCSAAASISATSSSISRKVRGGLGTRTRMRRLRAGLRSRWPSSIASSRIAEAVDELAESRRARAAPGGGGDLAGRRRRRWLDGGRAASLSLWALKARHISASISSRRTRRRMAADGSAQTRPIVGVGIRADRRSIAEDAVDRRLQPGDAYSWNVGDVGWRSRAGGGSRSPHPGADAGEDILELDRARRVVQRRRSRTRSPPAREAPTCSRRPWTWKRSSNARVPSASVLTSTVPWAAGHAVSPCTRRPRGAWRCDRSMLRPRSAAGSYGMSLMPWDGRPGALAGGAVPRPAAWLRIWRSRFHRSIAREVEADARPRAVAEPERASSAACA